jgi:hypothetical protein
VQRSLISSLDKKLAQVIQMAGRPIEGPHELEASLRQIYHSINDADLHDFDSLDLLKHAAHAMHGLFTARMVLRDRIAEWQAKGLLARPAEVALRDAFRIMRYANDMLGEVGIENRHLEADEKPRRAFTGRDYNTQVHPKYFDGRNIAFRSGDVLVVRGHAHNSAAIARIGDVDTQFSHTAMIYVDKEGKHWALEALIEDGAVINTLEHLLDHGIGRAVLYRHKDPMLAARAAELTHARIRASKGWSRHIPYDFSMRLTGRRRLFCAKLVHQAFLDASNGKVRLPAFKTRFDQRNREFFRSIGVRTTETYAPGDIDLDPSFDLVAEWQDYRSTASLRRQDMIMTKFFEWMETRGYGFRPDFFVRLISIFGRISSYFFDGVKELLSSVVPKIPSSMNRSTIATIIMLHKTAESLMPAMRALDENHVKMTGRPIHPRELLSHLERLREVSGGKIGYLRGKA